MDIFRKIVKTIEELPIVEELPSSLNAYGVLLKNDSKETVEDEAYWQLKGNPFNIEPEVEFTFKLGEYYYYVFVWEEETWGERFKA